MSQPDPQQPPVFAPAPSFAAAAATPAVAPAPAPAPALAPVPAPAPAASTVSLEDQPVAPGAIPSFAAIVEAAPLQIGGVAAASDEDVADRARRAHAEPAVATEWWWSPSLALALACVALTVQLVSFYVRFQLPLLVATGEPLDNFDRVFTSLPLIGSGAAPYLGALLAAGAMASVLLGSRRGVQQVKLQITIAVVATASFMAWIVLPVLFSTGG